MYKGENHDSVAVVIVIVFIGVMNYPGREKRKKFAVGTKERARMRLPRVRHAFFLVPLFRMRSYRSVPQYRGLNWIGRNRSSDVYIRREPVTLRSFARREPPE